MTADIEIIRDLEEGRITLQVSAAMDGPTITDLVENFAFALNGMGYSTEITMDPDEHD